MTANAPPKPHTEGMEWTNTETGIKYQFASGAWRAVSSAASEEVAEAIDNLDLQKVLDTGNVADKGAEFGGKVIVEPGTEGNEAVTYNQLITPTFDDVLQEGNVADTEATFKQPVTIHVPQSVTQPFIIKGVAVTGTANSNVLFVQNVSSPASRTAVRYRGIIDHDYDLANKKYVDDQASTPEFHRLMWDPTIRDFNGYKQNQPASVGQFCSMTGASTGVVWYYISDTDLDGRIIRLPFCTTTSSPKGFEIEIYFQRDVSDYLKAISPDVYADGKEYKKRLCIQQNQRPTGAFAGAIAAYPWSEMNASELADFDNEVWQEKREIFIKVK